MPYSVKFESEATISLDGVNSKKVNKGEVVTARSPRQEKILSHMVDREKAKEVTQGEIKKEREKGKAKKASETKAQQPAETKSQKSSE